jgi:hypothetical protein
MDLYKPEITAIRKMVADWLKNPKLELEATFGFSNGGSVDSSTFLAIAQRLQNRGYDAMENDDRLSVLTQKNIRFSLEGLDVLQSYCKDDSLKDRAFSVLYKDRTAREDNLELTEYDMLLKSRIEEELNPEDRLVKDLLDEWDTLPKGFRLIKRWTFKGKGMRIDMSMVRSTPKRASDKQFKWQTKFLDVNLFKEPIVYEVEVELLREEGVTDTPEGAEVCLIRGIGEILRAIQHNTLLIRKAAVDTVLAEYRALNGSNQFRGVPPVTLELKNMLPIEGAPDSKQVNIRNNYNVTDKADGLRVMGFCDSKGELFLLDMAMKVHRTGFACAACADSLVDGEWVTRSADGEAVNYFLIFDIYRYEKEDVSQFPFATFQGAEVDMANEKSRFVLLTRWITDWTKDKKLVAREADLPPAARLNVVAKKFLFASPLDPLSIFAACGDVLGVTDRLYNTDGVILTPNALPLPFKSGGTFFHQLKWKPAEDNTIDFLVEFEKGPDGTDLISRGINPATGLEIQYKTLRLFVNSEKNPAYDDPRRTILNEMPLPESEDRRAASDSKKGIKKVKQPSLFSPPDFPDSMASTCYIECEENRDTEELYVMTHDSQETIGDQTIVEMGYDALADPGWRWIPKRIRHDKTERFVRAHREAKERKSKEVNLAQTLNGERNANSIWNSIHNPVTRSMITTGSETPTAEELKGVSKGAKSYYTRSRTGKKGQEPAQALRDFHNRWIMKELLFKPLASGGGLKILDFACGRAGDIDLWYKNRAGFVLGVDIDREGLNNTNNGAYRRYLNYLVDHGRENVPPMLFINADSTQNLITGAAGSTPEDKVMLQSVFATSIPSPDIPLPRYVETKVGGMLRGGANLAVCKFALHYMFKDMASLDGFLKNLSECVKVGGYFIGCCTDGKTVFDKLRGIEMGHSIQGVSGKEMVWSIRKGYNVDEFPEGEASVGLPIDVDFVTIGDEHTEYLVSFDFLTEKLKEIGFALLTEAEIAALPNSALLRKKSTDLFGPTYDKATTKYPMTQTEKDFSFLSRWFIFKRGGEVDIEELPEGEKAVNVLEGAEAEELASIATSIKPRASEGAKVASAAAAAKEANAPFKLPEADKHFEAAEVYYFGPETSLGNTLGIDAPANKSKSKKGTEDKEDRYSRIIAPFWYFPIIDEDDAEKTEYPSLEAYWAAMKIKHAGMGSEPGKLAKRLFSTTEGKIHRDVNELMTADMRNAPTDTPKELRDKQTKRLLLELSMIRKRMVNTSLLTDYKIRIDEAKWNDVKDSFYRKGFEQRWQKDAMFHRIVETAREKGKYLLYNVSSTKYGAATGEFAGVRRKDGTIDGGNLYGRLIMEIAKFRFD